MDYEALARNEVTSLLFNDFTIQEGIAGRHRNNEEKVCYDLVARPRVHLIERGFDSGGVIVECKHFRTDEKRCHDVKVRDLLWQCIVYSYSDIVSATGALEKPLFVLYFISGNISPKGASELKALHPFVYRGGVGSLDVRYPRNWAMRFGGSYYFSQDRGRGPHNVGTKRMTGSAR